MKTPLAHRAKKLVVASAGMALALAGFAPAAHATTSAVPAVSAQPAVSALPVAASHQMSAATPFCVGEATPVGGTLTPSQARPACFSKRGQALAFGTDTPADANLSDADALAATISFATAPAKQAATANAAGVQPATTETLSFDFINAYYGGSSYQWTAPGGCSSSAWTANTVAGWQKTISSSLLVAAGGCNINFHYDAQYETGDRVNCTYGTPQTCYYIGNLLNDKTQSEYWSR